MKTLAALSLLVLAAPAAAQDDSIFSDAFGDTGADTRESTGPADGQWGVDPVNRSADLARGPWTFLSMSSLSWPDGRQATVTLWRSQLGEYARCFDYFDAAMVATGGKCERSGTGL